MALTEALQVMATFGIQPLPGDKKLNDPQAKAFFSHNLNAHGSAADMRAHLMAQIALNGPAT